MHRPNSSGNWGSRDKADRAGEANVTLMELENNQRWVGLSCYLVSSTTNFVLSL
jgi:hypothetical protein